MRSAEVRRHCAEGRGYGLPATPGCSGDYYEGERPWLTDGFNNHPVKDTRAGATPPDFATLA